MTSSGPGAKWSTRRSGGPRCGPGCASPAHLMSPCSSTTCPNTCGGWGRARCPGRCSWERTPRIRVPVWRRSWPIHGVSCWSPTGGTSRWSRVWTWARTSAWPGRPTHASWSWTPTRRLTGRHRPSEISRTSAPTRSATSSSRPGRPGRRRPAVARRVAWCSSVPCSPSAMHWGATAVVTCPCPCSTRTR